MNPRRPPAVLLRHTLNEHTDFRVDWWSTAFSRFPPPECLEAFPMPPRDRRGFHHSEGVGPLAPEAA